VDQETLVKAGQRLIEELENRGIAIRGAMWVQLPEISSWRLWIVGPSGKDASFKKDFYGTVAAALSTLQDDYPDMTISDVELKFDSDPTIKALGMMMGVTGTSSIHMSRNMVNGVYTPDGILLRMDL